MYSKAYKYKKVKMTNNLGQREYLLFRAGHMIPFCRSGNSSPSRKIESTACIVVTKLSY